MALSQKDIDELINSVLKTKEDEALSQVAKARLRVYDFKRPDKFSKDHLRGAQLLFDGFSRQLTSYFSGLLRMPVHTEVSSVDQVTYGEFAAGLSTPCCVAVVSWGQLSGNMLTNMSLRVILPVLDRLCGGMGASGAATRVLTEIEVAMSRKLTQSMCDILSATLKEFNIDLNLSVMSLETNALFIEQAMAPNDMVLAATVTIKLGNQSGLVEFCLPHVLLEPLLPALSANRWFSRQSGVPGKGTENVKDAISLVEVPISCRLGKTHLSVDDVLSLKKGDILELDVAETGCVTLYVFGKPKFKAKVGLAGNRMAARIVGLADGGEEDPVQ